MKFIFIIILIGLMGVSFVNADYPPLDKLFESWSFSDAKTDGATLNVDHDSLGDGSLAGDRKAGVSTGIVFPPDEAYRADGTTTSSGVLINDTTGLEAFIDLEEFFIEVCIRTTDTTQDAGIVASFDTDAGHGFLRLSINGGAGGNAGAVQFFFHGATNRLNGVIVINDGHPWSVGAQVNGSRQQIWINGTLDAERAVDAAVNAGDERFVIFARQEDRQLIDADMTVLRIWKNLTESEINSLATGEDTDLGIGCPSYDDLAIIPDIIPPVVNITNKNASDTIRINNVVNISCFTTDDTELSSGNITFNLTGPGDQYNFSFGLTGTEDFYSQNITTNISFGVINATCVTTDAAGNFALNSTLFTIIDDKPPAITLINLSSEGGEGQIIFNDGVVNKKLDGEARTNDTTPTIRIITDEDSRCAVIDNGRDLNYDDITLGSAECASTGVLNHICTLGDDNATGRILLHNFSIGCKDTFGNQNLSSTSSNFTINITDPFAPNSTLHTPISGQLFALGINNTINFTGSSVDNIDRNFTLSLQIDGVIEVTNTTYINGTNVSYFITVNTIGFHNYSYITTDSYNNVNQSENVTFELFDPEIPLYNITILHPLNNSAHLVNSIDLNWTSNITDISWCAYSLDGGANDTMICPPTPTDDYAYTGFNFNVIDSSSGITWNGSSFFIVSSGDDKVYEYSSAGVYTGFNFGVTNEQSNPLGIVWKSNRFYVGGSSPTIVFEYNSSGNYTGFNFNVAEDATPAGMAWDGTFFYSLGKNSNVVYRYTSAGVYTGFNFDISSEMSFSEGGIVWKSNRFYIAEFSTDAVFEYNSSGDYTGVNFSIGETTSSSGVTWNGSSLFISGFVSDSVFEYNSDEIIPTNITLTSISEGSHNVTIYANDSLGNNVQSELTVFNVLVPFNITLINLTSEATSASSIGQVLFNNTLEQIGINGEGRTNVTTPTFHINTSSIGTCIITPGLNINYSDAEADGYTDCDTTGNTHHICTLPIGNATNRTGVHPISIPCKDNAGNQNQTATFGIFFVNITDPIEPNATGLILNGSIFRKDKNDTSINFTFSATDNVDETFIAKLYIDNILTITNNSYINGTNASYLLDVTTIGVHTVYVNYTDSYNNINQSEIVFFTVDQEAIANLFLDGVADTRKYEYRSWVNISANCTAQFGGNCTIEIDLDAPGYGFNFSSGTNRTHFIFNITVLREVNFTDIGNTSTLTSTGPLNITSNNKTMIVNVSLEIISADESSDVNISYYGETITFVGTLKTIYLDNNKFIESNEVKDAVNLTYISGGSNFIFGNLTRVTNPINLSFRLTGFDLDIDNEFTYTEHFNGTDEAIGFNETLTYQVDAPLGIWDDFLLNTSIERWVFESVDNCVLEHITNNGGELRVTCADTLGDDTSATIILDDDNDIIMDMRDTSLINGMFKFDQNAQQTNQQIIIYATDGTSSELLFQQASEMHRGTVNVTFKKDKSDYTLWDVSTNASSGGGGGSRDISSLDFNQKIRLKFRAVDMKFDILNLEWGGVMLNRSTNNGTYKSEGNYTSRILNKSKTNLQKATLTWTSSEPDGTQVLGYVSNIMDEENPTFEQVTNGITHTFSTVGNYSGVRFSLNSIINITSPIVRKYTFDVTKSSITNVTVDLGNDGINEFESIGNLNATSGSLFVNLTPTPSQLNTIKISSETSGIIMVDEFKVNSSINPILLRNASFEDCSICIINFSFSGSNLIVSNLKFDFLGSWNYTAVARSASLKTSKIIQIFYSFFNVSIGSAYDFYDVFPASRNSTNVTPYRQTTNLPVWNLTNLGYDEVNDIYVKTNETLNVCINVSYNNHSNRTDPANFNFFLNTTYQKILTNITATTITTPNTHKGIWNWWDLYGCTNRFELPWVHFSSICSDCVFNQEFLPELNLIVE